MTQTALEAVTQAQECFQPETLEELRKHFPEIIQALTRLSELEPIIQELVEALKQISSAVKQKTWAIDSPTVVGGGDPEIGYQTWLEHEEWLHYAETSIERAEALAANSIAKIGGV